MTTKAARIVYNHERGWAGVKGSDERMLFPAREISRVHSIVVKEEVKKVHE